MQQIGTMETRLQDSNEQEKVGVSLRPVASDLASLPSRIQPPSIRNYLPAIIKEIRAQCVTK